MWTTLRQQKALGRLGSIPDARGALQQVPCFPLEPFLCSTLIESREETSVFGQIQPACSVLRFWPAYKVLRNNLQLRSY